MKAKPKIVNGWRLFAHPLFLEQLNSLKKEVGRHARKDPQHYQQKNVTKRLAAIYKLAFESIPNNPTNACFRLGNTLGTNNKHWFRAKFFQQYRLFFRYDIKLKVIIYVWVNDEDTKRAYGSKTDAYKTFEKMLRSGNPPKDWKQLFHTAQPIG